LDIFVNQAIELKYLNQVLMLVPGNIYWKDKQGRYLGCNYQQLQIAHVGALEEIIGKTDKDLYSSEIATQIMQTDKEIMEKRQERTLEEIGIDAFGKKTIYLTKKSPLYDELGQVIRNDWAVMQKQSVIAKEESTTLPSGKKIIQLSTKHPILDKKGHAIGITGVSINITKLKETQRALILEKREIADQTEAEFFENFQRDIKISPSVRWDRTKGRFYLGEAFGESYFTKREAQVLKYILDGLQPKQIALQINLSRKRIDFVILQLKRKLGCRTQIQLVKLAITQGWHCLLG
jgi:DNA-binding CsgD family transcriptional regulator